jgi:hypothetical protein
MPLTDDAGHALPRAQVKAKILEVDKRWGDAACWQAIAKNGSAYSRIDVQNGIGTRIITRLARSWCASPRGS